MRYVRLLTALFFTEALDPQKYLKMVQGETIPDMMDEVDAIKKKAKEDMNEQKQKFRREIGGLRKDHKVELRKAKGRLRRLANLFRSEYRNMMIKLRNNDKLRLRTDTGDLTGVATAMAEIKATLLDASKALKRASTEYGDKYIAFDKMFQSSVAARNHGQLLRANGEWNKFKEGLEVAYDMAHTARTLYNEVSGNITSQIQGTTTFFNTYQGKQTQVNRMLEAPAVNAASVAGKISSLKAKKDVALAGALSKKKSLQEDLLKYAKDAEKKGDRIVEKNAKDIAKDWARVGREVDRHIGAFVKAVNASDRSLDRRLEAVKRIADDVTETEQKWDDSEDGMKRTYSQVFEKNAKGYEEMKSRMRSWIKGFTNKTYDDWRDSNATAAEKISKARQTSGKTLSMFRKGMLKELEKSTEALASLQKLRKSKTSQYTSYLEKVIQKYDKDKRNAELVKIEYGKKLSALRRMVEVVKVSAHSTTKEDPTLSIRRIGDRAVGKIKSEWEEQKGTAHEMKTKFQEKIDAALQTERKGAGAMDADVQSIKDLALADNELAKDNFAKLQEQLDNAIDRSQSTREDAQRLSGAILQSRDDMGILEGKVQDRLHRELTKKIGKTLRTTAQKFRAGQEQYRQMTLSMPTYVKGVLATQNEAMKRAVRDRDAAAGEAVPSVINSEAKLRGLLPSYTREEEKIAATAGSSSAQVSALRKTLKRNADTLRGQMKKDFEDAQKGFEASVQKHDYQSKALTESTRVLSQLDRVIKEVQAEPPELQVKLDGAGLVGRVANAVESVDEAGKDLAARVQAVASQFRSVLATSSDLAPAEREAALRFLDGETRGLRALGDATLKAGEAQVQRAGIAGSAAMEKAAVLLGAQATEEQRQQSIAAAALQAAAERAGGEVRDVARAERRAAAVAQARNVEMANIVGPLSDLLGPDGLKLLDGPVLERARLLRAYGPVTRQADELLQKIARFRGVLPHTRALDHIVSDAEAGLDAETRQVAGDLHSVTAATSAAGVALAADRAETDRDARAAEDTLKSEEKHSEHSILDLIHLLSDEERSAISHSTESMRDLVDRMGGVVNQLPNFTRIHEQQYDLAKEMSHYRDFDLRDAFQSARDRMDSEANKLHAAADAEHSMAAQLSYDQGRIRSLPRSLPAVNVPELPRSHSAMLTFTHDLRATQASDSEYMVGDAKSANEGLQEVLKNEERQRDKVFEAQSEAQKLTTVALGKERKTVADGLGKGYEEAAAVSSKVAAADQTTSSLELGARQLAGFVGADATLRRAAQANQNRGADAATRHLARKLGVPRRPEVTPDVEHRFFLVDPDKVRPSPSATALLQLDAARQAEVADLAEINATLDAEDASDASGGTPTTMAPAGPTPGGRV